MPSIGNRPPPTSQPATRTQAPPKADRGAETGGTGAARQMQGQTDSISNDKPPAAPSAAPPQGPQQAMEGMKSPGTLSKMTGQLKAGLDSATPLLKNVAKTGADIGLGIGKFGLSIARAVLSNPAVQQAAANALTEGASAALNSGGKALENAGSGGTLGNAGAMLGHVMKKTGDSKAFKGAMEAGGKGAATAFGSGGGVADVIAGGATSGAIGGITSAVLPSDKKKAGTPEE